MLRRNKKKITLIIVLTWVVVQCHAQRESVINVDQMSAEVWDVQQRFSGRVSMPAVEHVTIYHNGVSHQVHLDDNQFDITLKMQHGKNDLRVETKSGNKIVKSELVTFRLMYNPMPVVMPWIETKGDTAFLHAQILDNPYQQTLQFYWMSRADNPAAVKIESPDEGTVAVLIPDQNGKYYFDLKVISNADTASYSTYCKRSGDKLSPFLIDTDYSTWVDDAIIYQITPYKFVQGGKLADITAKLPEIRSLGINTLWLQPVSQSAERGQGYDVVDYLAVNTELGSEADLKNLIGEARRLGVRVLLDVVLNHTSIQHPYAKDVRRHGERSHYYRYYQHEFDGSPYASFYNKDANGFVYYFWKDLVNLDYDNEEVQCWMIEVCKYWLTQYHIDGFRFDAIWGVNARNPDFAKRLRRELKSINPDILMLAEDKPIQGESSNGFDVSYDWTADTTWVSQWSWQYQYDERKSFTLFTHPDVSTRVGMLADALFGSESSRQPRLRFLENNDLPRFINGHNIDQVRMAATLLFSVTGIPMLYNGQEIGFPVHPYSPGDIFRRDRSISSLDTAGLFSLYKQLIAIRNNHSALRSKQIVKAFQHPEAGILGFSRDDRHEKIFVFVNLSETPYALKITDVTGDDDGYMLKDLVTGEKFNASKRSPQRTISLPGYTTRMLVVAK